MTTFTEEVRIVLNGHHLQGHKVQHQWRWLCSFPELVQKYSGHAQPFEMVRHFLDLANQVTTQAELKPSV